MLFLLQAAAQHITVTVDKMPLQPGMSEWGKSLISAGVGAAFAILGGLAMEFVKPFIAKRFVRKTAFSLVTEELRSNLETVEAALRIMADADNRSPDARAKGYKMAQAIMTTINTDRFDDYFTKEKAIVYELDLERSLTGFFHVAKLCATSAAGSDGWTLGPPEVTMAYVAGRGYLNLHHIPYNPRPHAFENLYWRTIPDPPEPVKSRDGLPWLHIPPAPIVDL